MCLESTLPAVGAVAIRIGAFSNDFGIELTAREQLDSKVIADYGRRSPGWQWGQEWRVVAYPSESGHGIAGEVAERAAS